MKRCAWITLSFVLLSCAPAVGATSSAPAKTSKTSKAAATKPASTKPAATAPTRYLDDSELIARVEQRRLTVFNFRDRYFASEAKFRPAADSAGRVEFLHNMVNKEVMGLAARRINPELDFVDRVKLRQATNTILSNVLYQRYAVDSVKITRADADAIYPQFSRELHLREILFADRETAERVRRDLRNGRITWKDAARRYSIAKDRAPDGDAGWVNRTQVAGEMGLEAFTLEPGAISKVVQDMKGFHLVQVLEARPYDAPAFPGVRRMIYGDLRSTRIEPYLNQLMHDARAHAGVVYDTVNIKWAASKFADLLAMGAPQGATIDLAGKLPTFEPADTGRVLARTRTRVFSLNDFLTGYRAISPVLRHRVISLEPFIFTLDGLLLEQDLVAIALERGIDRDSLARTQIEDTREALLVEHVYRDSIESRVSITPAQKRKFYEAHRKEFVSIPSVRYAQVIEPDERSADSLIALLDQGQSVERMLHADSLRGAATGAIRETRRTDPGNYNKVLFEELTPGKSTKVGPDARGQYMVLHLIESRPEAPMSYEQVEDIVDESVRNIETEKRLDAFLARHKRGLKIESHPELVMRIHLSDPAIELPFD
jgi:hypothetical protein